MINFAIMTFVPIIFMVGPLKQDKVTLWVSHDYVRYTSGTEYVEWSQQNVNKFLIENNSFRQITPQIVNEVYKQATCKVAPQPIDPTVIHIYITHSSMVKIHIDKCKK